MAVTAVSELDADLAQFGGSQLDGLAITLTGTTAQTSDYAAVNLGQLKALAQPFYDRLLAVGYFGPPIIVTGTTPVITGTYPWIGPGMVANDYAMANIGQVKNLFSFDVTYSSGTNGLPDWWANKYFPGQTVDSGSAVAWSGGQVTILQAYQNGWNPIDFYNGQAPMLSVVSGNSQIGPPGGYVPMPLVVSVTDANGNGITGAPVTFQVASGGGYVQAPGAPQASGSATVLANGSGQAQVYFLLSSSSNNTSQIDVTTGTGVPPQEVEFSASSDNGGGQIASPFAPSNCIGSVNADGSLNLSWTNNTNGIENYILVEQQQSDGSWKAVSEHLPAGTADYIITSPTGSGQYRVDPYTPDGLNPGGDPPNPGPPFFFPIPVQNYVAIDVSGGRSFASCESVALGDDNNGAFCFSTKTGYASTTWVNGQASGAVYDPGFPYSIGDCLFTSYAPVPSVAPDGTLYGALGVTDTTSSNSAAFGYAFGPGYGSPVEADDGGSGFVLPDNPPTAGELLWSCDYGCCQNGCYGYASRVTADGDTATFESFVSFGGSPAGTWSIECSSTDIYFSPSTDFNPVGISDGGYAIGSDKMRQNAVFMDTDGSLTTVDNATFQAVNNKGQVIGAGYFSDEDESFFLPPEAFIWQKNTGYTPLASLIPAPYQGELSDIEAYQISNPDANGIIHIRLVANGGNYILSGPYKSLSPTTTTLAEVQYPNDNIYIEINNLNANGLMVLLNGDTSVELLVPVDFTVVNFSPTSDETGAGVTEPWTIPSTGQQGVYINPGTMHADATTVHISVRDKSLPQAMRDQIASNYQFGLIQNVTSVGRTANYPATQQVEVMQHGTPRLDMAPNAVSGVPWAYTAVRFSADDQDRILSDLPDSPGWGGSYNDPRTGQPNALSSLRFSDQFTLWLAVSTVDTSTYQYLDYVHWSLDCTVKVDCSKPVGSRVNSQSVNLSVGSVHTGMGGSSPSLQPPVANDDAVIRNNAQ